MFLRKQISSVISTTKPWRFPIESDEEDTNEKIEYIAIVGKNANLERLMFFPSSLGEVAWRCLIVHRMVYFLIFFWNRCMLSLLHVYSCSLMNSFNLDVSFVWCTILWTSICICDGFDCAGWRMCLMSRRNIFYLDLMIFAQIIFWSMRSEVDAW